MKRRHVLLGGAAVAAGAVAYGATGGPDYEAAVSASRDPSAARALGDFEFLVHHAALAANSHNTQPWLFSGSKDKIMIRPDFARSTPVADPDNHHLFASLGCASENLVLAASSMGRSGAVAFDPGATAVNIDLTASGGAADPLFAAIGERQCTRSLYDGRAVPATALNSLATAARVDRCEVMLITDRPRMEQLLELILAANTVQIKNPAFVKELRHWLRFNAADAIRSGDGLYAACSGNPTMPNWVAGLILPFVLTAEAENDKYAAQARSSAGFAVFVSDRDDPAHWVQAGRSYTRFALKATELGIRNAFLNQPLEVGTYRRQVASLLGLGARRPDMIVRFGYGDAMPRALRRPINDVIATA
jgi:nitroreductase